MDAGFSIASGGVDTHEVVQIQEQDSRAGCAEFCGVITICCDQADQGTRRGPNSTIRLPNWANPQASEVCYEWCGWEICCSK